MKNGTLPTRTEKIDGRDGRPVLKTLNRVADLDGVLGLAHCPRCQPRPTDAHSR